MQKYGIAKRSQINEREGKIHWAQQPAQISKTK
jgi:hypothetical protein